MKSKIVFILLLIFFSTSFYGQTNLGLQVAEYQTVLFGADTTSPGTKMMWVPSKAAFLVGNYPATYDSIGRYSFAAGASKASNDYATSFGLSVASGANSFASGLSTARKYGSTAIGISTSTTSERASSQASDFPSTRRIWRKIWPWLANDNGSTIDGR